MSDTTLAQLKQQAWDLVERVSDDPNGRYQLRVEFYKKYGFGKVNNLGFGDSELVFLRWEIDRGVLNPIDNPKQPGSPWWRKVNEAFIYNAELSRLIHEANLDNIEVSDQVAYWLNYMRQPTPVNWYRAHNASIVSGYINYLPEAQAEDRPEQIFLNIVLYRLLYAQLLIEAPEHNLTGYLGSILASPKASTVGILVHIPGFYPTNYPLNPQDIQDITHQGHHLTRIPKDVLDEMIILPNLYKLYHEAAHWLTLAPLEYFQEDDKPIYPNLVQVQEII